MKAAPNTTPARGRRKPSPKTTLKEVVIPTSNFKVSHRHGKRVLPSQSPESSFSGLSSLGGQFSDDETPETSAIMTPAESLTKRETLARPLSKPTGEKDKTQMTEAGVSNKRKRGHVDDDALLAQMLQDREYQKDLSRNGLAKRRRRNAIEDSGDDLSPPDVIEVSSSETDHRPSKGRRTHRTLSLPSRAARESAKKSIKAEISRKILDTDSDDSGLSDYISAEDLDDLAESEANEDNLSAFETTASENAPTNPSHRRRGRRSLPSGTRQQQRQAIVTPAPSNGVASWRTQRLTRVSKHNAVPQINH